MLKKIFLFLIAGFAFLIGASNYLINQTVLNRELIAVIEEKVSNLSKGNLRLEGLKTNLFLLTLSSKNFSFTYKDDTIDLNLKVPEISSRLSLLGILFGEVRLADLVINSPSLELNLDSTTKETNTSHLDFIKEIDTLIEKNFINDLSLKNLELLIKEKQGDKKNEYKAKSLNLSLNSLYNRSIQGIISLESFYIESNKKEIFRSSHFVSNLKLTKNIFSLKKILLQVEKSSLGGKLETVFIRNKKTKKVEEFTSKSLFTINLDLETLKQKLDLKKTNGVLQLTNRSKARYHLLNQKFIHTESKGTIKSQKAKISNFNLLDSVISYEIKKDSIYFDNIKAIDEEKNFATGNGYLYFTKEIPFDFNLTLTQTSLQDIFSIFNVDNDSIDLNLEAQSLHLKGKGKPLNIEISGQAQATHFELLNLNTNKTETGYASCDFNVDIHIDKNHLDFGNKTKGFCSIKENKHLSQKSLKKGDLTLQGDIYFKAETDLHFTSEKVPYALASTFLPIELDGYGSLYTNVYSLNKKTNSRITFSGEKVRIKKIPLKTSYGSISFLDDKLHLNTVTAYANSGDLLAQGTIDFANKTFAIKAKSNNLKRTSITAIRKHFFPDRPLHFSMKELEADIIGDIENPLAASGTFKAQLKRVNWGNEKIFDTFKTEFTRNQKKIEFKKCLAFSNIYQISCDGFIDVTKGTSFKNKTFEIFQIYSENFFNFSYNLKKRKLSSTKSFTPYIPFIDPFLTKASLHSEHSFSGFFKGTPKDYSLVQEGSLKEVTYKKILNLPIVSYKINLNREQLNLSFKQKGRSLSGKIKTGWNKKDWPFTATFSLNQFDTRFLLPELFYENPKNFSYLSGDLEFQGLAKISKIHTAKVVFSDFYLNYFHERSNETNYFELKLDKSYSYTIKDTPQKEQKKSEDLNIKNQHLDITFKNFDTLLQKNGKVHISGTIDLSLFSQLLPNIAYSKGFSDLLGSFSFSENKLNYEFNLKNKMFDYNGDPLPAFSLMIPELEPQFENILFDLTYKNGVFYVNHFFSEKGNGSITAKGNFVYNKPEIDLDPLLFIEFNNTIVNLKTPYLKEISTNLSGRLFIKEKKEPYQLYGNIEVNQLSSNMNYNFTQEAIRSLQKKQLTASLTKIKKSPFVSFNIGISANKTINISNNNLNLIASGEMKLLGSNQNIVLSGLLKTDSGIFRYKRDFSIERCFIYFDVGDNLNPSLDIKATSLIDNYTVGLNILGKASSPLVDFDINPKVSKVDNTQINNLEIMYLISQGTLPESKDTPLSNNIITENKNLIASLNYATEVLPLDVLDNILGNKYIYLRPEINDLWGDGSIITLTTIINLKKNLDIKVRASPTKLSRANLSLEYKVTPQIQIKTLFDLKMGDRENNINSRNQSFNIKFNFPF
jgi:hypothetical protein